MISRRKKMRAALYIGYLLQLKDCAVQATDEATENPCAPSEITIQVLSTLSTGNAYDLLTSACENATYVYDNQLKEVQVGFLAATAQVIDPASSTYPFTYTNASGKPQIIMVDEPAEAGQDFNGLQLAYSESGIILDKQISFTLKLVNCMEPSYISWPSWPPLYWPETSLIAKYRLNTD